MAAPKYFAFLFSVSVCLLLLQNTGVRGCTYRDGLRYSGPDLETVFTGGREGCCIECGKLADCNAFNYALGGVNAGQCTLKNNSWTQVVDSAYSSGISYGDCEFLDNTELLLFDIMTIANTTSKEQCCSECGHTNKCAGFTYYKSGPRAQSCLLKYATNNKVPAPSVNSGIVAGGVCTFDAGIEYRGFDLQTVTNVASQTDCCNKCKATARCSAFSYSVNDPKAKTCVLKTTSLSMIPNNNAVSGKAKGLTCTGFSY